MRRADAILVVVGVAFGGFIAYAAIHAPRRDPPPAQTQTPAAPTTITANELIVASGGLPAPVRNIDAIRAQLQAHQAGTFINEILAGRDSNIARWPDRREHAVKVWIDEHSPLVGAERPLPAEVRRAFADWGAAGVPLTFTFIGDSAPAEVHVTFVDHFNEAISGLTTWKRDYNWWILGGDIQVSLRSGSGRPLNDEQIHAIALHEIGHLLGLNHTADTTAIMAPRVGVLQLSPLDINTMRLIYELPPGSVKKP
jgi:hypothetical protein